MPQQRKYSSTQPNASAGKAPPQPGIKSDTAALARLILPTPPTSWATPSMAWSC